MSSNYFEGQPAGGGGPSTSGGFIGVPDDHSVPATLADYFKPGGATRVNGMEFPTNAPHVPQYRDGAEQNIRRLSAENLARLQAQLASVGLIGPETKFRVGVPDSTTVTAYKRLLEVANNYAISDSDALDLLAKTPQLRGDGTQIGPDGQVVGGPSKSVNTTVSDPVFTDAVTARATLRATLSDRLGRAPTADEYHRYRTLLSNEEAGQDVTTTITRTDGEGKSRTRVKRSDDTTDPSAAAVADDFSRRGKLGREANTHVAATDYFNIIDRLTGG